MKRLLFACMALTMLPLLAACGNGGASEPPINQVDPASSQLQFAVGIATIAYNGGASSAIGLNTVETLRQANGLSGALYDVPTITGPSNFSVGISTETGNAVLYAGSDAGSNHISWSTLNQTAWTGQPRGLKAATTGVFGYGFCPCNQDAGSTNGTPSLYQAFNLPVYGDDELLFYGGPPAFPRVDESVSALGFEGYSLGFTDFAIQPVLGSYRLNVAVPPAFTQPGNPTPTPNPGNSPTPAPGVISTTAVLASLNALPPFTTPTFSPDGRGGGTVRVRVPSGVTETILTLRAIGGSGSGSCVLSHESDQYYTLVTHGIGTQKLTLPDALGQASSGAATPSICPSQSYAIYAAGFNYPAYESAYPQNLSIAPPIAGANGQANVTTSAALQGTYP
jgi:predicted small lipoprotein YifL